MRILRASALLVVLSAGSLRCQPSRVVSTTPSITEMLFALGAGGRVVGVSTYCRYPPAAAPLPKIGTYLSPNLEAIAALQPDLVIIEVNPARLRERLEALRLKVLEVDYNTLAGIDASIRRIAAALGIAGAGQRLAVQISADLERIRARSARLPRRRGMFIVGRTPGAIEGLVVVGRGSYLGEVVEAAGGENIFGKVISAYPKVSIEEVIGRNPEVIVDMGDMAEASEIGEDQRRAVLALWRRYPMIEAVKRNRVHVLAPEMYVTPGPRVVEAARRLALLLHPEASW